MEIIGLALLFGVFFAIDYRDLLQGEQRNLSLAVYLSLLAMGLAVGLLTVAYKNPISPTTIIEYGVRSLLALF